jgi:hypothetical protein
MGSGTRVVVVRANGIVNKNVSASGGFNVDPSIGKTKDGAMLDMQFLAGNKPDAVDSVDPVWLIPLILRLRSVTTSFTPAAMTIPFWPPLGLSSNWRLVGRSRKSDNSCFTHFKNSLSLVISIEHCQSCQDPRPSGPGKTQAYGFM